MRILLVSQMYPGPADPDLGTFVAQMERALVERGHDVQLAVLDRRGGGKRRFLELRRKVEAAARPDVVWAHFLVPTGLIAASVDAPLVVTAHGRDVRNIGAIPGVAALTRRVVRRASTVIAVSDYLRRELELKLPEARGKTEVVDSGVDLDRFAPTSSSDSSLERPAFVAIGSLTERKNVVRLADAFARLGRGSLTFVGDGPLRSRLEGRAGVRSPAASRTTRCRRSSRAPTSSARRRCSSRSASRSSRRWPAAAPSSPRASAARRSSCHRKPGSSSTRSTSTSWPARSRRPPAFPSPNGAARAAAAEHDVRLQAERVEAILLRAARDRPA